jgi:ribulose-phosphate 3-epimerase
VNELAACGADVVVVHVEIAEDYVQVVRQIKQSGLQAGLAILPGSDLPAELEDILPELSLLVANTVGPAYAGQPFDPRGLKNMAQLSQLVSDSGLTMEIAADGNVSVERLDDLLAAGCTHLVCGTSSIFKPNNDLAEALAGFRGQVAARVKKIFATQQNLSQT